jgi:hypothetical protein
MLGVDNQAFKQLAIGLLVLAGVMGASMIWKNGFELFTSRLYT